MGKSKVISSKSETFLSGGKAHMISKGGANPQKPGVTTQEGMKGGDGAKFLAGGGSNHMLGHMTAAPSVAGQTSPAMSDSSKWAQGGKGHMVGNTGAQCAKPR